MSSDRTKQIVCIHIYIYARGVMVIVIGNRHGDTGSNPGRGYLHFTLGKGNYPIMLRPAMGK